jgi:formylglycine-generating enzyme required for sulfatase activity
MRRVQQAVAFGGLAALGLWAVLAGDPAGRAADKSPADFKPYTQKIPGTEVSFDMVPIPGGTFVMGSPDAEPGRSPDEGPQHPVELRPFWMGKCEVTWDEFLAYMNEKGAENPEINDEILKKNPDAITGPTPTYVEKDYGHGFEGKPALCMTHHAAMEYCRWLSAKTGKVYRLPTEAEWEYAARAGTKTAFFFGDDAARLGEYAWYVKNSPDADHEEGTTHKVGTKQPNPWGLYDMYGNVMEWCVDHYKKDGYATCPLDKAILQPVVLPTTDRFPHVARGGSWTDGPDRCRSSARRSSDKSWLKHDPQQPKSIWWLTKMDVIGFRVVRAVEEQENLRGLRSKVTRESK